MRVAITWLGHATTVLGFDSARVLTDPLLGKHVFPLRRRGPRPAPSDWADVDAVLLSHLHHDHADLGSLRMLSGCPVYTSAGNATWLRRHGVDGVDIGSGCWRQLTGDLAVRLVPAVHHSRPMPHRPNESSGFLLRSKRSTGGESAVAWFAGDTALYEGMRELPDLAGAPIDVAVVPVGGWGPRLSAGHMDPEQAAQACALAGPRWVVPVHWGTLHPPLLRHLPPGWMDRPAAEFVRQLSSLAPACRPVVLGLGASVTVG